MMASLRQWLTHIKKCMFHLYFLAEKVDFRQKSVNFAVEKIEIIVLILKRIKIMTTIFTLAFAAVMFSGMVFCMGMFLKHVVSSIPEVTNINHRFCLSK